MRAAIVDVYLTVSTIEARWTRASIGECCEILRTSATVQTWRRLARYVAALAPGPSPAGFTGAPERAQCVEAAAMLAAYAHLVIYKCACAIVI